MSDPTLCAPDIWTDVVSFALGNIQNGGSQSSVLDTITELSNAVQAVLRGRPVIISAAITGLFARTGQQDPFFGCRVRHLTVLPPEDHAILDEEQQREWSTRMRTVLRRFPLIRSVTLWQGASVDGLETFSHTSTLWALQDVRLSGPPRWELSYSLPTIPEQFAMPVIYQAVSPNIRKIMCGNACAMAAAFMAADCHEDVHAVIQALSLSGSPDGAGTILCSVPGGAFQTSFIPGVDRNLLVVRDDANECSHVSPMHGTFSGRRLMVYIGERHWDAATQSMTGPTLRLPVVMREAVPDLECVVYLGFDHE